MNIVLMNTPVHAPTVMPYSLAMLHASIASSLKEKIHVIDLNAQYHYEQYRAFYDQKAKGDFFTVLTKFINTTRKDYSHISKTVLNANTPKGFDSLLKTILAKKPDVVGISLTYNSQVFFAKCLINALQEQHIDVVVGGPADYQKLLKGIKTFPNAKLFIDYLVSKGATPQQKHAVLDYSPFHPEYYMTKDIIYTLRTAISCPYKRCTFCTHHGNAPYRMINPEFIEEAIVTNKMKKVCIIDDDIPAMRLELLAQIMKKHHIKWWCQLRPLKHLIPLLAPLKDSGLTGIAWGVESGCQRVLDFMEKGTKLDDVAEVLATSKKVGIYNNTYVMFGLPSETKEEFMQTISFLEKNNENIDLVSPSVFGLQQGSRIYDDPTTFGVNKVTTEKRTFLGDKIMYQPTTGLSQQEAQKLKKKNLGRIRAINSLPQVINACKEQVLNL